MNLQLDFLLYNSPRDSKRKRRSYTFQNRNQPSLDQWKLFCLKLTSGLTNVSNDKNKSVFWSFVTTISCQKYQIWNYSECTLNGCSSIRNNAIYLIISFVFILIFLYSLIVQRKILQAHNNSIKWGT